MNCACKEWHRNGNRFRCYFGIKQGCRPAKIFANATAPLHIAVNSEVVGIEVHEVVDVCFKSFHFVFLLLIYKCRVSVPNSQLGLNPLIV